MCLTLRASDAAVGEAVSTDRILLQVDTTMTALLEVAQAALLLMRDHSGTIVHISSISRQLTSPLGIRVRVVKPGTGCAFARGKMPMLLSKTKGPRMTQVPAEE